MAKRNRFPPEPETMPAPREPRAPAARTSGPSPRSASGPASKGKPARSEVPTVPPPPKGTSAEEPAEPRTSGVQPRKPRESGSPRATVDEVTADLSKDPRRERE